MKYRIKTLSTAGILGILVWSPAVMQGDTEKEPQATAEPSALISKDSHPNEALIVERLLTATPERLARARATIEKIEKMTEEEKQAALEAVRKTLVERRRAFRNLSPEEREKMRNMSPEERAKMRQERQQRAPRREQMEQGRRGPGPRGPQADRPERPERSERPNRPERPRRDRSQSPDTPAKEAPAKE